jgi:hypothetical protein
MGLDWNFNGRIAPPPTGLEGKISVMPSALTDGTWQKAFGMSPLKFYDMVTNGVPGAKLDVSFEGGDATVNLTCAVDRKTVFKAEDCAFDRRQGVLTIARDRRETEVRAYRQGLGLGRVFLSNMIDLAQALNLKKINLYGGKEDGTSFWPRYGAELENGPGTVPYDRFVAQVESNIEKAPDDIAVAARAILASPSPWVSVELARLRGAVGGRQAGAAVLAGTNTMLCYDLTHPDKVDFTRTALGDMAKLRAGIATAFAAPGAPAPVPAL